MFLLKLAFDAYCEKVFKLLGAPFDNYKETIISETQTKEKMNVKTKYEKRNKVVFFAAPDSFEIDSVSVYHF